jgi:hypothetical protein
MYKNIIKIKINGKFVNLKKLCFGKILKQNVYFTKK